MSERVERIPVIQFWGVLLVPLQGDVTDGQVAELVSEVLERVRRGESQGLAIDLSGLSIVDSHLCAAFANLAAAARYMGTRTILCGLSPEAAMTLQTMGFELRGLDVALTLERALEMLGLRPASASSDGLEAARRLADEMMAAEAAPRTTTNDAKRE